ncbi:MAG: hypothetical protein ACR2P4_07130 [Gammaproteobacteria bacterium]
MNRRIKQISPERATENNSGDYDDVGGVFAGLCPAKEWDALSGLDTLKCRLTGRCPVL